MGTDKRARQKAGRQQRLQQVAQTQQRDQRKRSVVGFLVVLALVAVAVVVILLTQKDNKSQVATGASSTVAGATTLPGGTTTPGSTTPVASSSGKGPLYGTAACPATDGSSKRTIDFTSAPKKCLDAGKTYTATIKTTAGTVVMTVDASKAPAAANSFVFLSRYHYYDNTKLFRVNTGIDIIQGGGPHTQTNSDPGPGFTLQDEPPFATDAGAGGLKGPYTYKAGDFALANTGQPNSAGGQFFFITGPNGSNLDSSGTYMIIGHVTSGLPILQNIVKTSKATPTGQGEAEPNPAASITSVTISEK